jgi:hypothetical protein
MAVKAIADQIKRLRVFTSLVYGLIASFETPGQANPDVRKSGIDQNLASITKTL